MKKVAIILMVSLALASQAIANVGNSKVQFKVYGMWVSSDPLCSNPVNVFQSATPVTTDLLANPTLFSGNLASGVYNCVVLQVSDQWTIQPTASDGGSCVSGTPVVYDICQAGISTDNIDGTTTNCTSNTEDKIFIYLSVASTGNPDTILGVFQKPVSNPDTQHGYNLPNAFQVSGSVTSTMTVANVLNNSLGTQSGQCALLASPHFIYQ